MECGVGAEGRVKDPELRGGEFVVDPRAVGVVSGGFTAQPPPTYSTSLSVRFAEDPQLKLMVPISVRERYWFETNRRRIGSRSRRRTRFRRFQVTTSEQIRPLR